MIEYYNSKNDFRGFTMGKGQETHVFRDELTGLLEKQTFYNCSQELIDIMDGDSDYAFVFFDVENFKLYNDNYGYESGDLLLKEVAEIINDVFEGQLVSRFTGDHFAVFTKTVQIVPSIKQIRTRIKENQRNVNLELKAGIFVVKDKSLVAMKCCDRARTACASIKKRYDRAYCFYDDELDGAILRKQFILDHLDEAIEKGYIQVYYQPMVRTLTGKLCSWEALVRWIDPVKGIIYPTDFIPVLEEYRRITQIDQFVIEQVIKNITQCIQEGREIVPVSVNLSRLDFEVLDITSFIDSLMEKYQCPKYMCHFEITESVITDNPALIKSQIKKLKQNGFSVWMDDFGSGYSSLNTLKNFEFDVVKIDMEFLRDFDETNHGKIILRHVISLVKNLGMHTLIEGVETREQYEFVKALGCEIVQGYLIGRPMPFIESFEYVASQGIESEDNEARLFYNAIGKIDVLRQNPLQNFGTDLTKNPVPLSIGIVKDHKWKFIYTNTGYRNEMLINGDADNESAEAMINNSDKWERYAHFWNMCEKSKESQQQETMDFVEKGRIVNLKIRHIAEDTIGGMDAYLLSMRTVSRFVDKDLDEKMNIITKGMFSLYERIDVYGITENCFENLYLENNRLYLKNENKVPREVINELASKRIYSEDRERFLSYMNIDTIEERLTNTKNRKAISLFRVIDDEGSYKWKTVSLSLINLGGNLSMLVCVSIVDDFISRSIEAELADGYSADAIVGESQNIIANVLKMTPIGIFWKDTERRFLGANKMFLDYYGFNSVDAILGKTDEDMGWHINPEPFRSIELDVIHNGKIIKDVAGECIVKGEVRDIVATKMPFVIDGELIGLIGFFKDVTDENVEKNKLKKISRTDELTGIYNRRGFKDIIGRYEEQYKEDGMDFALFLLDIDKFKQINDIYGHEFGDVILKAVSERLRIVASENSLVFRFGGDEFVILHMFQKLQENEEIMHDINHQISKIKMIEHTEVKLRLSVGMAVYSEVNDIGLLLDEADKRMYTDKSNHKK